MATFYGEDGEALALCRVSLCMCMCAVYVH